MKPSHLQVQSKPGVFISSTFTDLSAEREAVANAAEKAGLRTIGLEEFGATPKSVDQVVADAIRSADLFVLIVAFRYGYVQGGSEKSTIEREFDEARKQRKPVQVYMLAEDAPWPQDQIATGEELVQIKKFRQRLLHDLAVGWFRDTNELRERAVVNFIGWKTEGKPLTEGSGDVEAGSAFGPMLLEIRSQLALLVERSLTQPRLPSDRPEVDIRPAEFLGRAAATPDPDRVFVIMPYSTEWSAAVERVLREACESAGVKVDIAKSREGRFIINDIWQGITGSAITIADLTGGNPNVAYEVGLADVLGRQVILISQESEVPVDFRGARLILYKNTIEGALALRETVTDRLRKLLSAQKGASAVTETES